MIFKKPVLSDGFTESTFECKRDGLTIRGTIYRPKGDHLPIQSFVTDLWHGKTV